MAQKYLHWYNTDTPHPTYLCGHAKAEGDIHLFDYCTTGNPSKWNNHCVFIRRGYQRGIAYVRRKSKTRKPWCRKCLKEIRHQLTIHSLEKCL